MPSGTAQNAFQWWFHGHPSVFEATPMRQLATTDFTGKEPRRRWGEYKFLVGLMLQYLHDEKLLIDNPSPSEVSSMFEHAKKAIAQSTLTPTGRKRKEDERCQWTGVAAAMRKMHPKNKKNAEEE